MNKEFTGGWFGFFERTSYGNKRTICLVNQNSKHCGFKKEALAIKRTNEAAERNKDAGLCYMLYLNSFEDAIKHQSIATKQIITR